ncbi:MAG TPA: prolyl oligopeptidase family serine peptidase [Steroidobacteraceae bacterium]|nr:prolyl oligopeptidase family serine peptidase [Steroidobacteraceae bacterium]
MRPRTRLSILSLLLMITAVANAAQPATPAFQDPYLWLEDVDGARAMDWVREQNARTTAVLDVDPHFAPFYRDALALAEAKDRIALPSQLDRQIYNVWQDAEHTHGLWRRTSLAQYQRKNVPWTSVLDLDALSKQEKANWFWAGAQCAEPAERRCLLSLSDGGEDATTVREFDLRSAKFVAGGFELPKGKQSAVWQDDDHLWVAREWAPGELTASGYAYVVKRLARGQPLSAAQELYRGQKTDVGAEPFVLYDGTGHHALGVVRNITFFESETRLQTPSGLALLDLPRKASVIGLVDGRMLIDLREAWQVDGSEFASGSVVSVELARALAEPGKLEPTLVYAPGERRSFDTAAATRGHLLLTELDNVRGRAWVYTPAAHGAWTRRQLPLPDNSTIAIVDTDPHSERVFLSVDGFLTPSTLWLGDAARGRAQIVKTLPQRFDASRDVVRQLEATSKDGTRIPYFIVQRADLKPDGSTPTILTAYGGFQVSETPYYSGTAGKLWLEHGGALVLANIRGGGEFGPAWHEAGLKTHRQVVYDDFAAVAQDLIARGITSPAHLGIRGGSNGGLLMGVEFNQHPQLWGAVSIEVPLLDMLRYEQIAAGSSWVGEYGSVSVPEERAFLESISPYQNLKAGVKYPLPLVWTTTKDDRVGPQHARKFAARLNELGIPYLYYEVIEGGHASGATPAERSAMTAREYVYFARQLGL